MVKYKTYLAVFISTFVGLFIGCVNNKRTTASLIIDQGCECTINLPNGLIEAKLGTTTLEDVVQCYGAGVESVEKIPWKLDFQGGYKIKRMRYDDLDLEFVVNQKPSLMQGQNKGTITSVIIGSNSTCLLPDGQSLGINYNNLIAQKEIEKLNSNKIQKVGGYPSIKTDSVMTFITRESGHLRYTRLTFSSNRSEDNPNLIAVEMSR